MWPAAGRCRICAPPIIEASRADNALGEVRRQAARKQQRRHATRPAAAVATFSSAKRRGEIEGQLVGMLDHAQPRRPATAVQAGRIRSRTRELVDRLQHRPFQRSAETSCARSRETDRAAAGPLRSRRSSVGSTGSISVRLRIAMRVGRGGRDLERDGAAIGMADQMDAAAGLVEVRRSGMRLPRPASVGSSSEHAIAAIAGNIRRDDRDSCRRAPRRVRPIAGPNRASNAARRRRLRGVVGEEP